ncbi:MAG: SUMF1/EgtB/PvdO family nonheme iron enzyme [Chloroflexi bacterium]|uniref:SUMF1/EgtB/PvdO family nonheme iron enzyme n=1 Tax=Candidatus Chlorohelix allophototropha TaxID=3003348 RepID=A0A8T7MAR9_9CHLR|nr:SUMF1/EgtB/PvdO family nonheme iron enzyme [Chloroflexota bacterium]WJW70426.1 SUMF1/EgtB/PvdO family nonheme iron enzyme [Chloroflexota bacterium L227-S17]
MPTLFISYKRGTTVVAPLMEKLKETGYRLWFDREDIHLGDPSWKARIDAGLEQCEGVILCISPAACQSEPIRYEVCKALEFKKPIFPIILEKVESASAAIADLGLPGEQHLEDFTDVTRWQENLEKLRKGLEAQGLRVTRHDRRKERNTQEYALHQRYLKKLAERVGLLNLAHVNEAEKRGIELEKVYVDSPTALSISLEVKDWRVIDWWLSRSDQPARELPGEDKAPKRTRVEEMGYERSPFEVLIGGVDEEIARYREENPHAKPDEKYSWNNPWNNGVKENQTHLHLTHLAAGCDRLVILGAPGSGKSTFVKYLALCLAGAGIEGWNRAANLNSLENWTHGALTPVYVELRRFVASTYFPSKISEPATAQHLWKYIEGELLGEGLETYASELEYDLEQGHALLILDGLDEVPYPEGKLKERQTQIINLAQSLHTRFAGSRVIVASRPYAYQGWSLPDYEAVTISEFEEEHRIELASRLYRAMGLSEEEAQAKAEALNEQLEEIDDELKDRPLFVTLMATLYLKGGEDGLPSRKGALYRESILLLLERWGKSKPGSPSLVEILGDKSVADLYGRLAALAYAVQGSSEGREQAAEIDESLLYKHLKPLGREVAAELIPYLCENAGVLVAPGQRGEEEIFHYAHRSFQEYLAAVHLVKLCRDSDSFKPVQAQLLEKPETWRVVCCFVGDVLADTKKKSEIWLLLADLLEEEEIPEKREDLRWWLIWLAATIAQEQEICGLEKAKRSNDRSTLKKMVEWLKALLGTVQALGAVERAECGRALGLLGDLRKGVGTKPYKLAGREVELPELEWCDIGASEGGKFVMGSDDWEDNPRREMELGYSYRMTKYLITYGQYQTFAESGEYEQAEWWEGFPEEYQPQKLDQDYMKENNRPRDYVSWYQSVAFTRWLTVKYRAAGEIGVNEEIRLPTEAEWEYAARGVDERKYPYGNEFDGTKGNTDETGIGATSAVGSFPDGASPFGVLDMSGNVWEWCLNKYKEPEEVGVDESGDNRVLRGGSCLDDGARASCVFRNYDYPYGDDYFIGFRLVVCSAMRHSEL